MTMPSNKNLIFILFLCFIFSSFSQHEKHVTNFKSIISTIDTLTIYPTFLDIKFIDVNKKFQSDTTCINNYIFQVNKLSKELLQEKYTINNIDLPFEIDSIKLSKIKEISQIIDTTNKNLNNIIFPKELIIGETKNASKYIIINIIEGVYKSDQLIRKEKLELIPTNIALGIISLGTLSIQPQNNYACISRTFLIETNTNQIIYYYSTKSIDHPKSISLIESIVQKSLKKIYYKK